MSLDIFQRKKSHREFKRRFKPWITDHILNKIKYKNKLLSRITKCSDRDEKAVLKSEFNGIKNEITRLTRTSKKEFYEKYFTKHKQNLSKTWQGIKQIINTKSKNSDYPSCIIDKSDTITDPTEIANRFNNFYASVADNILEKRKYNGNTSFRDYLTGPLDATMALYECDEVEVFNLILMLNPKKKNGPNSIPTEILHLLANDICKPLSIIFNKSFASGECPDLLKMASTVPIKKEFQIDSFQLQTYLSAFKYQQNLGKTHV